MTRSEIRLTVAILVLLAGLLAATWWTCDRADEIGNSILIATAAVVFWYTLETARLRRDAETRTKREATPQIYFEVVQRPGAHTMSERACRASPAVAVQSGEELQLRFILINHSAIDALALVQVRIRMGSIVEGFYEDAYGGKLAWEVTPFFNVDGYFNVYDLIAKAQRQAGSDAWPSEPMWLAAQVDTYDRRGRRLESILKEYTLNMDLSTRVVSFWPEVAVRHFEWIKRADILPEETRVTRRWTEPRS